MKNQKKIRFSGAGASHQNLASECAINKVVNMDSTISIHTELICHLDTFSTDIFTMVMNYYVWLYNWIIDINSVRSTI